MLELVRKRNNFPDFRGFGVNFLVNSRGSQKAVISILELIGKQLSWDSFRLLMVVMLVLVMAMAVVVMVVMVVIVVMVGVCVCGIHRRPHLVKQRSDLLKHRANVQDVLKAPRRSTMTAQIF